MPTRRVKEDTSTGKEAVAEFIFFMLRPLYPENHQCPNMGHASLPPFLPPSLLPSLPPLPRALPPYFGSGKAGVCSRASSSS